MTLQEQERAAYMAGDYTLADALARIFALETAALALLHVTLPTGDPDVYEAAKALREAIQ